MSLIDKKNLNYLSTVEQFFLSLKDSGLSLSASDYHLITGWEDRGVPVRLLCLPQPTFKFQSPLSCKYCLLHLSEQTFLAGRY